MMPTYAAQPTREQLQAEIAELKRLLASERIAREKAEAQLLERNHGGVRYAVCAAKLSNPKVTQGKP